MFRRSGGRRLPLQAPALIRAPWRRSAIRVDVHRDQPSGGAGFGFPSDLAVEGDGGAPDRGNPDGHLRQVAKPQWRLEVELHVGPGHRRVRVLEQPDPVKQLDLGCFEQPDRGRVVIAAGKVDIGELDSSLDSRLRQAAGRSVDLFVHLTGCRGGSGQAVRDLVVGPIPPRSNRTRFRPPLEPGRETLYCFAPAR